MSRHTGQDGHSHRGANVHGRFPHHAAGGQPIFLARLPISMLSPLSQTRGFLPSPSPLQGVSAVPVLDGQDRVAGVVSARDARLLITRPTRLRFVHKPLSFFEELHVEPFKHAVSATVTGKASSGSGSLLHLLSCCLPLFPPVDNHSSGNYDFARSRVGSCSLSCAPRIHCGRGQASAGRNQSARCHCHLCPGAQRQQDQRLLCRLEMSEKDLCFS